MTFRITELSNFGIIMAADSSESTCDGQSFEEVDKIIYFTRFNIGISTWGDAVVENKGINDWLKEKIDEFKGTKTEENIRNKYLEEVSEFLAKKLNEAFPNGDSVLGLHIASYTYSKRHEEYRPGVFHVHNHDKRKVREIRICHTPEHREGDPTKFIAEKTRPILEKDDAIHLRNGIYEEFALFFPALQGLKETFRNTIMLSHENMINPGNLDLIKIEAESVANWVRLMCNTFTEAGLSPYIGKKIRVLALQVNKLRKFTLDEFSEEEW